MDVPARKLPRWLAGYVAALEFDSPGRPLDIAELGARFKLSPQRTREIAYALAQIGWLRRVSHGVYEFIPAAAVYPSASNWLPFAHVSAPYFVSGLAAAQVLRLTTQLPSRQLVVIPQRTRAPKAFSRAGMRIVRVTPDRHYGWDEIDVEGVSVRVASTARLVIDLVEHPDWFTDAGVPEKLSGEPFRDAPAEVRSRIGERADGPAVESRLSRGEQPAMSDELAATMARANADYEAKFGRIFLIRAKGRSAADIYDALRHRLSLGREEEAAIAIGELREIALLRLAERVTP